MAYKKQQKQVIEMMERRAGPIWGHVIPWLTAKEWSGLLRWSVPKTRYWLEYCVDHRQVVWRWHPHLDGWYATKQYACAWVAK